MLKHSVGVRERSSLGWKGGLHSVCPNIFLQSGPDRGGEGEKRAVNCAPLHFLMLYSLHLFTTVRNITFIFQMLIYVKQLI